jgi:exonuclease SbcC
VKTTKITIKNLFGIAEQELDGRSVELTGKNGTGKSSVLDAIRYALENSSERDFIIKQGEKEGEIIIEAGSALRIQRKKRLEQADYKSVKDNGREVGSAETFLRSIFTPLQLDPVAFIHMPKAEQNRLILDMIEFPWDMDWIKKQFGEVPPGVDYEQNILQVLNDIQAENGEYFMSRQDINRDIRFKKASIDDIAKDIPASYDAKKWEEYDVGAVYREIEKKNEHNRAVERAKAIIETEQGKLRAIVADFEGGMAAAERAIASEKSSIQQNIARMEAEIKAEKERLEGLADKLADKRKVLEAQRDGAIAALKSSASDAKETANQKLYDTTELQNEVTQAEAMKKHLREYARMRTMQTELDGLVADSEELTRKIELARSLPGTILETAKLPIPGLTVEDGRPLINGLPVSNLSDGEKLDLCVEVALAKPNSLQIILIDGAEKLSDDNRKKLYDRCREKGLQFISSRTTNEDELTVTYLGE